MAYSQTYDVFKPEIWSAKLNRAFERNLVAAKFFDNYSNDIAGKGDVVYIPAISNGFTAASINTTSGDITPTNLSDTKSSITINNWEGATFIFTDFDKATIGAQYNLQSEYIHKMGYALAAQLDTDILALGASIDKGLGDSATSLTATVLEQAIAFMESSSIPLSECAFIFHPNAYKQMCLSCENMIRKSLKLLGTLIEAIIETISSGANKLLDRSTTIIRTPYGVMV